MGLLTGKTALIFGVANDHSIAWGIAQAFHREGATLGFSYANEKLERRVRPLAESLGADWVEPCDVGKDEDIAAIMAKAGQRFGQIDILVHSVAFADRADLSGPYYTVSRQGFLTAMDISVYSFTALARAALPLLRPGGALLTLTYIGAQRAVPHYNVMGVAKAALEASVRYLAADFGADARRIRVNAISAGPIRTLAVAGIAGVQRERWDVVVHLPRQHHAAHPAARHDDRGAGEGQRRQSRAGQRAGDDSARHDAASDGDQRDHAGIPQHRPATVLRADQRRRQPVHHGPAAAPPERSRPVDGQRGADERHGLDTAGPGALVCRLEGDRRGQQRRA